MVVIRQCPARRAQAVAIQRAGGVVAAAHHQSRGAVPRLHVQCIVFVERGEVFVHVLTCRVSRRHQHAHGGEHVQAASQQHFQRVVQALGIRTALAHQRTDVAEIDLRRMQDRFARLHPATIAADGVDLAVVREHANGCASRHCGEVLVEKRWWNTTASLTSAG